MFPSFTLSAVNGHPITMFHWPRSDPCMGNKRLPGCHIGSFQAWMKTESFSYGLRMRTITKENSSIRLAAKPVCIFAIFAIAFPRVALWWWGLWRLNVGSPWRASIFVSIHHDGKPGRVRPKLPKLVFANLVGSSQKSMFPSRQFYVELGWACDESVVCYIGWHARDRCFDGLGAGLVSGVP